VATAVRGLPAGRPPKEISDQLKAQARDLEDQGLSREEMSRQLGVSPVTLRRWLGRSPRADQYQTKPETLKVAREMVDNGVPYVRIARGLGISQTTLRQHFGPSPIESGLAIANERRSRQAQERYEEMVRLRMKEGLANQEVADRLGISLSRVWAQMGPTPKRLGGQRTHDSGLHDRALYLWTTDCYSQAEIARQMGLPKSTIYDWISGRRRSQEE
jgi:DNA-binding CsgD family transcriptional regulator/transposase